jgi:arylsulfatase A-like enzyme
MAGALVGPAAPRPNIVVILIDDLRWDELGCAGHPFAATPNIDRLAREGALFRNAFVTTPLCSPSRASFLTGQYAHTHGITDNTARVAQSHRLVTFPHLLRDNGYETAFIGKWHMGNDDSPRPGFDRWVSFKGQGAYFDPDLNEDGRPAKVSGYTTDILTDRSVDFIRRPRRKPFCLYLAHKAVHPNMIQHDDGHVEIPPGGGFTPAERHKALYSDRPVPRRPNAKSGPVGKPALERKIDGLPPLSLETGTDDETVRNRLRLLAAVEEGMGRILAALEENGQLDKTLIVFTSDNGYFYGEHGLSEERRLAYEESIRIPLLMRYPPLIRAGLRIDPFALNVDLAPTVLALAGVPLPASMQGRNLAPLFAGKTRGWRESFLIEYFSDTVFPRVRNMGYQALRGARWKYIHYTELEAMDELYDLQQDPYEMRNVIGNDMRRLEQMRIELRKLFARGTTI